MCVCVYNTYIFISLKAMDNKYSEDKNNSFGIDWNHLNDQGLTCNCRWYMNTHFSMCGDIVICIGFLKGTCEISLKIWYSFQLKM